MTDQAVIGSTMGRWRSVDDSQTVTPGWQLWDVDIRTLMPWWFHEGDSRWPANTSTHHFVHQTMANFSFKIVVSVYTWCRNHETTFQKNINKESLVIGNKRPDTHSQQLHCKISSCQIGNNIKANFREYVAVLNHKYDRVTNYLLISRTLETRTPSSN